MSTENIALEVAKLLKKKYPQPKTELNHDGEYQLFVAVCLSAQTTDKKVNEVTSGFFKRYKNWGDLSTAHVEEVRESIYGVNFHKGKAERLINAAQIVLTNYDENLPKNLEELIKLPGVARKTANVLLQELWGIAEGIVVDTHVTRVSSRLRLTKNKDAKKIERDLMKIIPKEYWRNISSAMVLHGRYVCTARKPKCEECVLNKICSSAFDN